MCSVHVCVCVQCERACMHACMHAARARVAACVCACMCMYVHLCVRMHVKGRGRYRGRVKLLDRVVTTSGRRIEQLGNFKATCIHVLIACSWNFGVGPEKLRKLFDWCYRDVR